ncbi:MAG: cation acetate symporter [Gammaproteobacteria bacterium]|nr:cation acetate symporter [Gammaproteobacteria bacterium]
MSQQLLIYFVVGGSFLLYIGLAIYSKANSTSDFYVAGKHVSPVANGMATAADWMSAASFISMAGLIAFLGYDGSVYLMGWTGGYVILALLLAPYLRKFGKFTVPEFIGDRYDSQVARTVAVICLIVISFTYVAGQMRGVGIVFARFLNVDLTIGLLTGMTIVFVYAVFGGMKGITYTQVAQYCVMIFAYTLPAIFITFQVTNVPIPQVGFGSELADGSGYLLHRLDQVVTELGFSSYTDGSKATIDVFFITMALMIGTAGLPHVIVRFFTVPRVRDARISAGYALLFIAILYTTAPAVGSLARWNLTATIQTGEVGEPDANLVYEERPQWFKTWEDTGLISFEDKNSDGRIQYYNDANAEFAASAEEFGWEGNELTLDKDILVLANPEIAGLPDWVVAFIAAGAIAAALSTAAGLLLVISAAISHDLVKSVFNRNMSDRHELIVGRICAAVAILLAGRLGLDPPAFVAEVVAFAFGIAAASLFPVILLGIFSVRVNGLGAICGMLTGLLFTTFYINAFKGMLFSPFFENVPENWLFGISPEGIGVVGALLNFAVTLGVSYATKAPRQEIVALVHSLRTPRIAAGNERSHG